ncbi:hypothetical protein AMTR_s00021p00206960 [Amborella trichopoda]|uniref:Uncharacterized protein n=1 Tax=Amborella trichopoda TaxID=13333 RepID=W1Q0H5_AMBTC|nr:hypothetical protein AMTR_s00021p00206960 [Amborella trichopoda]
MKRYVTLPNATLPERTYTVSERCVTLSKRTYTVMKRCVTLLERTYEVPELCAPPVAYCRSTLKQYWSLVTQNAPLLERIYAVPERYVYEEETMNVKSSAKSKRAHSLHGRRTHNPSPKPSPSTKKQSDQTLTRHDSRLPSNWDRYDDIDFSGAQPEDPNQENVNVGPKSKGADYAYLLSLAKSESLSLLSFDSVIPGISATANALSLSVVVFYCEFIIN